MRVHPEQPLEDGLDHLHEVGWEGRAELLRERLVIVDLFKVCACVREALQAGAAAVHGDAHAISCDVHSRNEDDEGDTSWNGPLGVAAWASG